MATGLFDSIGHFLDSCVDSGIPQLYDSMLLDSLNHVDLEPSMRRINSRAGEIRFVKKINALRWTCLATT